MTVHDPIGTDVRLETTDDGFLGGALQILQPKRGYRAGLEAVFLAASIPAGSGDAALEAGCGVGVASLCLARRVDGVSVTGVEIEPALAELGCENARRNRLDRAVRIARSDVCGVRDDAALGCNTQDHVFANPPFFTAGSARRSDDPLKNRAHICDPKDLDSWVRFLVSLAAPTGTVTIIYRAEGLGELLHLLDRRVGNCHVYPLHPRAGQPAGRGIVQGVKGSRAPVTLLPGIVLHGDGDAFTEDAQAILRHGAALRLM
ncbi:MAG: tRNA1(Val) (adenine(37)-N6)-methyltransferase [Hyphomicrobiales bacterium]